jgi:hypothetical protein
MRTVNRADVPAPTVLTKPGGPGPSETQKAIAFYRKKTNRDSPFPFKTYSHEDVKKALETLFSKKCAYCESPYAATQPMDVEHWRPKGTVAVEMGKEKPGYYWLAANWDNLLPSCTDCNRRRYHTVPGSSEKVLLGKEGQFPLADESKRATKPNDELHEEPLLLNPCDTAVDPMLHLEFVEDEDNVAFLRPRQISPGKASARGAASIRVYALNRTDLVQARRNLYFTIVGKFSTIQTLMKVLDTAADDKLRQELDASLLRQLGELKRMKDPTSAYSAWATQVVDRCMATLTQEGPRTAQHNSTEGFRHS